MDSSLTASLLLLSVVFMQFVSAADQNNTPINVKHGNDVILPCEDPDQGEITVIEWSRTDLGPSKFVLLYKDKKINPEAQHPSYRNRVDLKQMDKGDVSLLLKDTTTNDIGTYECRTTTGKHAKKLISTVSLVVSEPFPVWAIVLLVLLVLLVLVAAAGVSFYFWLRWKLAQQVEVKAGVKSVQLPCRTTENLDRDVRVEWRDGWNRKVHVYQNGSDQPDEQSQFYRTRTKMDGNLLKNKNLSLTLKRPTYGDRGIYSCRVYNRDGHVLMKKDIWLKVKGTDQEDTDG
ncbi:uncharacterized protein LOC106939591 isoform X2 [Poecilia latipinna]|uniref:uncharacterized protein LOC106939591 isoform X2 n=1 Tax=Poecilia latipinna TaxID=48699 RepID=UPI00072DD8B8|nr:PREDICTED: uncharacterized protein LOC106939591 isoform X2 [Poecilia latipinna]